MGSGIYHNSAGTDLINVSLIYIAPMSLGQSGCTGGISIPLIKQAFS